MARLPDHQALFREAHQRIERQGERGQDEDAGEHGIDVEAALRLEDQVTHALGGINRNRKMSDQ